MEQAHREAPANGGFANRFVGCYGSIGTDASHGCVRMRIPDVISLYARAPVGTPVHVA